MDKIYQNVSEIENFFNSLIDNKVSENTFFSNLPISIESDWTDIVVVDVASAIRDVDAYGYGTVMVFLYAKPNNNGRKNVKRLSEMEEALNACIESASHDHYCIRRGGTYTEYDETRNLHCNIFEIPILIV